jgi:hypothetical protein
VYDGYRLSKDSLLRLWYVRSFQQALSEAVGKVRGRTLLLGHTVLCVVLQVQQRLLWRMQIVLLGFVYDPCLQVLESCTSYLLNHVTEPLNLELVDE